MTAEVRVPSTGNSGEDAVLVEWRVSVGDLVQVDTVLATIETAKTTLDIVAPAAGTILRLLAEPGDEVPELGVIAEIGDVSPGHLAEVTAPQTLRISPRARIMAERRGMRPTTITGTGPQGRILIADVMREVQTVVAPQAPVPSTKSTIPSAERKPLRGARKVTAQRMATTVSEVAAVTLQRSTPAEVLLGFAGRLKGATDPRIGVNELIMFAVATTLPRHPQANAHFSWDGITEFAEVHLGFAVDNGRALLVPVIRDAHCMSVKTFAHESHRLTQLARDEQLTPAHMQDATFTVTNLGSLGVEWFNPIVNMPAVCILGVGAIQQRDGGFHLPLSLTFDHRALDGASAARCLADIASTIAAIDVVAALSGSEASARAE